MAVLFLVALILFRGTAQENSSATLTLDWGGQKRTFQGAVVSGMTVLDVLQASAAVGSIPLEFSMGSENAVKITRLDGFQGQAGGSMVVTINGQNIDLAMINTVLVQPRDRIVIKLNETP